MGKLKKRYLVPPIFRGKNITEGEYGDIDPETGEKIKFYKNFDFSSLSEKDKALLILRRYKRIHGGVPSRQKYYPNCTGLIKKIRDWPSIYLPVLTPLERDFLKEAESEGQAKGRFLSPVINVNGEYLEVRGPKEVLSWREAAFLDSSPYPITSPIIKTSEVEDVAYKINGKWYNHWGEVK